MVELNISYPFCHISTSFDKCGDNDASDATFVAKIYFMLDNAVLKQNCVSKCLAVRRLKSGVGNSFGFAGHIRDSLGIPGPVYVHLN